MPKYKFSWDNFLLRLIAALILVFASYNPEGYSYYHWAIANLPDYSPLKIFVGVVLVIGWAIFLRATFRSLGLIGTVLASAFFGTLIWLVVDWGLVKPENVKGVSYLALIALSGVLSAGVSWSHIRRRITGQIDVDETDE
ncbi:MAG: DUF6524 family protein [Gammaproteobacteria bacterium]|nr:DUF6524 family protein [Gammaproteobacteria bacterium]